MTLYEAVTRRRPFPDGEPAENGTCRYPQLTTRAAPVPRGVPAPLAEGIEACLEPDPAGRPTAAELADALEPVAASLPRPKLGKFRPTDR